MRHAQLALLLAVATITATAFCQAENISIDFNATPLAEALNRLQQVSGLRLAFSNDVVNEAEPVTLKAENEPVDDVLLRMLRPRGLECVYTGESMAAVVRAESDMGMAKMAGRALRTFVRLEKKLEGAVQAGDEVRVPGWTKEDDRELAEAIADSLACVSYCEMKGRDGTNEFGASAAEATRLMVSFDPEVRAAMAIIVAEWQQAGASDDGWARLREAAGGPRQDPDPLVRACSLYALCRIDAYGHRRDLLHLQAEIAAKPGDVPAECRFALAMTATPGVTERLRTDDNAAVRFIAWLRWQRERLWISSDVIYGPDQIPPALQASAGALLADRNPILRALGPWCMTFGLGWASRSTIKVPAAARAVAGGNDAWLKAAIEGNAPLLEAAAAYRDARIKLGPASAMRGVIALLISGKPSHESLGIASVIAAQWSFLRLCLFEPMLKLDASSVAALAESDRLWPRIAGIAANGLIDADESRRRISAALTSESEIDRLAGLLACTMLSLNGRVPAPSPEMEAAMVASFRRPAYVENALAARALGRGMAIEKVLPILRDEVRKNPRLPRTRFLLQAAIDPGGQRARAEWREQIQDLVMESGDPGLQTFFLQKDDLWISDPPQLAKVILGCRPEVLAWLLSDFRANSRLKESMWRPAISERIASIAADAATRAIAGRTMASYVTLSSRSLDKANKRLLLPVAAQVLAPCFEKGADDGQIAAGFDLIAALLRNGPFSWPDALDWVEMPAAGRDAAARALSWANDPPHNKRAADLLASLCRWSEGRKAVAATGLNGMGRRPGVDDG